jgi:hypothetical protein
MEIRIEREYPVTTMPRDLVMPETLKNVIVTTNRLIETT